MPYFFFEKSVFVKHTTPHPSPITNPVTRTRTSSRVTYTRSPGPGPGPPQGSPVIVYASEEAQSSSDGFGEVQNAVLSFLSDLYSNDKCTEKLKFIFISFVFWVDRGACHHIRGGETGGALEEADSQMFLWKSQAQDMGQLKFTMHWLM